MPTDLRPALLFTYGTLRDPDVQRAVFRRRIVGRPDVLPGFRLGELQLDGATYPIALACPAAGAAVAGAVLRVMPEELARADAYEGPEYRRVTVRLRSGRNAWVYVGA